MYVLNQRLQLLFWFFCFVFISSSFQKKLLFCSRHLARVILNTGVRLKKSWLTSAIGRFFLWRSFWRRAGESFLARETVTLSWLHEIYQGWSTLCKKTAIVYCDQVLLLANFYTQRLSVFIHDEIWEWSRV